MIGCQSSYFHGFGGLLTCSWPTWKFSFVHYDGYGSIIIFLHDNVQFAQHHLLKMKPSSACILASLSNIICLLLYGVITGSYLNSLNGWISFYANTMAYLCCRYLIWFKIWNGGTSSSSFKFLIIFLWLILLFAFLLILSFYGVFLFFFIIIIIIIIRCLLMF